MGLTELATQLTEDAKSGSVTLNMATLASAGLKPPADLDTELACAFELGTSPLTLATSPDQIGTPADHELKMTGELRALGVDVKPATVTFTSPDDTAVSLTLLAPLGSWTLETSFPTMAGYPFDQLKLASPSFVFSSDAVSKYSLDGHDTALAKGLNLVSMTDIDTGLSPLLAMLGSPPAGPFPLTGPLDPGVIDGKTLNMPDAELTAPLLDGPLPKLGFIELSDADLGLGVTTQTTVSGDKAQYRNSSLLLKVTLGDGVDKLELDARVSATVGSKAVTLLIYPDPTTPLGIERIFALAGGRNWYSDIPGPLQGLFNAFKFKGFQAVIDTAGKSPSLASVDITVGSTDEWPVFGDDLKVKELDFNWTIIDPAGEAQTLAQFGGQLAFFPKIFKGLFYVTVTSDLKLSAQYLGSVKLSDAVKELSKDNVHLPDHWDLELTEFGVFIDQPRKAFSVNAAANASLDVLGSGKLQLLGVELSFARVMTTPTSTNAALSGSLLVGGVALDVDAEYDNGAWHFDGGLTPGSTIPIGDLVNDLFETMKLPDVVPGNLGVTPLRLTADVPVTGAGKYSVDAGLRWVFTLVSPNDMELDARVQLSYDGATKAYTGAVSGETKLPGLGLDVTVRYEFAPGNRVLKLIWAGFGEADYQIDKSVATFKVTAASLGELIAHLVGAIEGDPGFELPPPWNLLNEISLKGFELDWNLKPKKGETPFTVKYEFGANKINLWFIEISGLTLSSQDGKVMIGLDATFITGEKLAPFPAQDPPPAPGAKASPFVLDLLALGQHVTVDGLDKVTSVDGAVALLESFTPPTDPNKLPVQADPAKGQPVYAPGSQWLVGTRFMILYDKNAKPKPVALLTLEGIFNDPQIYGLKITAGGPKAGIFQNLALEIMYRKVSPSVGVYEVVLQLPDFARHIELGEVSITLPVIGVQVYTNGDWRVDLGFPANMDFSRSFGIEAFPFTGQGGFYFGVLSNDTAPQIPHTSKGHFDPVYVFGLGLRVGLGKSIDEGVFSAELSVTVFGIVEGVVAEWHPYGPAQLPETTGGAIDALYYYRITGTVGVIGKVDGSVNFAIISADVSITVQAFVTMTVEAYRAIPVHMEAGVSVAITLKINLGLFSIKIHLSFSMTVKADFTIGSNSTAPWDPGGQLAAPRAAVAELEAGAPIRLAARTFETLDVEDGLDLPLYAAPTLTLADWTTGTQPQAAWVVTLYLDGATAFETLARETLLWALSSFGGAEQPTARAEALSTGVSRDQAKEAFAYFAADGASPVAYPDIQKFLSTHFKLTIGPPPTQAIDHATVMPMIPDLVLQVPAYGGSPAQTIDFTKQSTCGAVYLEALQKLLAELDVQLTTPLQRDHATPSKGHIERIVTDASLAQFVFEDYFALICRHMLQAACDAFDRYAYRAGDNDSLQTIADVFDAANHVTPEKVADANAELALAATLTLTIPGAKHTVLSSESLGGIASGYGLDPVAVAQLNETLEGLLVAGKTVEVDGTTYPIGPRETFASLVATTKQPLTAVVAGVAPRKDLLVPLAVVALPDFRHQTATSPADTLSGLAAAYGVTVAAIATANATVSGIFQKTSGGTVVHVPGLEVLTAQQAIDELHESQVYANLAGIAARFFLNGLRLPDIDSTGAPLAETSGMHALIGQQVTLPPLTDDTYALTLEQGAGGGWIGFTTGSSLTMTADAAQVGAVQGVLKAAAPALEPATTSVAAMSETAGVRRRFGLPTPTPVRLPAAMTLPVGTASTQPTAFGLPDGLLTVLASDAARPAFSLQRGTPGAAGALVLTPVASYGWATLVPVTVRRTPGADPSSAAARTYDLIGTDPAGIVLLERLLDAIGQGHHSISGMQILYSPNATGPAVDGLEGDDPAAISTFIVQSNLSTETRPPTGGVRGAAGAPPPVDSDSESFARLLWECSVVGGTGYSLYYEASQGGPGLPDHLFDQDGRAQVQLLLLHSEPGGVLGSFVNAAVIGDAIDPKRDTLFAESEPLTISVPVAGKDTLEDIAARTHLTPSELAAALEDVTLDLAGGAQLSISGALYETRYGDTLAAIAGRFGVTGDQVEKANKDLVIDWNAIPPWTLLAIPGSTYALATDSQLTTLGEIATRFGLTVQALGWLNRAVPKLFPEGTVTVTDEIVDPTAVVPPGTAGFAVARDLKSGDQTDPAIYLDASFHLLGYQLVENVGFGAGPGGLPVAPHDPLPPDELARPPAERRSPRSMADNTSLSYEQLLPVARYARFNPLASSTGDVPPGSANPYAGVGFAAQPALEWRDLFGNRARTPLSDAALDPAGPQGEPPIPVTYSDRLLGVAQWPSVAAQYSIVDGPELSVELSFDVARYAGAGKPGPERRHAEADRQTFASAYYQLNQSRPDGTPHVTMALCTSLDGGRPHALTGSDESHVTGFVLAAWQYLDQLIGGGPERTDPITAGFSMPVSATNDADIYELVTSVAISRDPALVADECRDEDGVADAVAEIPPKQDAGEGATPTLVTFATAFEHVFATATTTLKVAVGDSREEAAGPSGARRVWAVRTSRDATAPIGVDVTGDALFWAPPPLSTSTVSRNHVEIWPFDPEKGLEPDQPDYRDYTGVDLDVWARQALEAIDRALSPRYAVPGYVVDARVASKPTLLDRLRAAKTTLAASISSNVTTVLDSPPLPDDPAALKDAQEEWRQQLLVTLASAYAVDVAVQLPVKVCSNPDPRYEPPALYGHPQDGGAKGKPGDAPPYSLSTFKIPARNGASFLTFLFTASDPGEQKCAEVDVTYLVDQVEHQIGPVTGIDGYKASTWLTFPLALDPLATGKLEVPIVLRAYPDPPVLRAQASEQQLDHTNARALLESATEWTYTATYDQVHVAQDVVEATGTFNVAPSAVRGFAQKDEDLFTALARLLAVDAAIQAAFDADLATLTTATDPSSDQFKRAHNALDAFVTLVEAIASNWPVGNQGGLRAAGEAVKGSHPLRFAIAESAYDDDLLVTVTPHDSLPPGVPLPELAFDGYDPVPTNGGVRYRSVKDQSFLGWDAARDIPGRTVATGPLEVLQVQNARLGVQLTRNASLVPDNPTRKPFVYETPLVLFASPFTPLLGVPDAIDVAAIDTGQPQRRPLVEQLRSMLSSFFAHAADGKHTLKLQAGYRVWLDGGGTGPAVDVPIALVPAADFTVKDDWAPGKDCPEPAQTGDPFVCRLATTLRKWVTDNVPDPDGALTFELATFSTIGQSTLPLVDLSGLYLRRADISDL